MRVMKQDVFLKSLLSLVLFFSSLVIAAQSSLVKEQRLSQWLFEHYKEPKCSDSKHHDKRFSYAFRKGNNRKALIDANDYLSGLMWLVPEEENTQVALKQSLLNELTLFQKYARTKEQKLQFSRLKATLKTVPVTGRALISVPDPLWLEIHPAEDPLLKPGQSVFLPKQPHTVTLLREDGSICQLPFIPAALAKTYIQLCNGMSGVDYAWIAQPDGRTNYYGVALWNEEPQDPPMPGAWIWAPKRNSKIHKLFSQQLIDFLGTQGVSSDPKSSLTLPSMPNFKITKKMRGPEYTANDWGMIGLLQMPSARMEPEGEVRFQGTFIYPYHIGTIAFQPFNWLEGAFRYVRIRNQRYGPSISKLDYMDKSFDLKLKLWSESAYFPELALGGQDIAGTGLFSGEYLVANKRFKDFDFTLGLGWGYLGNQSNILNPFGLWSPNFNNRINDVGVGGNFSWRSYFRGPTSVFGGLIWHTPWESLLFKMEYSSNEYEHLLGDPKSIVQQSPINLGIVYRLNAYIDLMTAYERGNTGMVGFTFHSSLPQLRPMKIFDLPPPPVLPSAKVEMPNWSNTTADIKRLTGWSVKSIMEKGDTLNIQIGNTYESYRGGRFEKVIAVLHRDAPAHIKNFVLIFGEYGMNLDAKQVNRAVWVSQQLEAQPPSLTAPAITPQKPESFNSYSRTMRNNSLLWQSKKIDFSGGISPSFSHFTGGPDAYVLYQAGFYASGELRLNTANTLSGILALRVFDNYDHFVYDGTSNLQRVRTDMRQYILTSTTTIPNLQFTHMQQLSDNQFISVYGGLLEPMFAGVGAEWLYRPWHSSFAFGVDYNFVQQRGYAQDFSMKDYKVGTGQFTFYWDTGWNGVLMQLSAGQFLAGDRGIEIDLSRTFGNGIVMGAYASKTNVTMEQFGEGGFNKGLYLIVPFDDILPISTPGDAYFQWQPLLRDGGAELNRSYPLYAMTANRQRPF